MAHADTVDRVEADLGAQSAIRPVAKEAASIQLKQQKAKGKRLKEEGHSRLGRPDVVQTGQAGQTLSRQARQARCCPLLSRRPTTRRHSKRVRKQKLEIEKVGNYKEQEAKLEVASTMAANNYQWGFQSNHEEDVISVAAAQITQIADKLVSSSSSPNPSPSKSTPPSPFKQTSTNLSEEKALQGTRIRCTAGAPVMPWLPVATSSSSVCFQIYSDQNNGNEEKIQIPPSSSSINAYIVNKSKPKKKDPSSPLLLAKPPSARPRRLIGAAHENSSEAGILKSARLQPVSDDINNDSGDGIFFLINGSVFEQWQHLRTTAAKASRRPKSGDRPHRSNPSWASLAASSSSHPSSGSIPNSKSGKPIFNRSSSPSQPPSDDSSPDRRRATQLRPHASRCPSF
ncbi:hypothetical protein ACLOJK_028727 [Asimina triloba]